MELKAFPLLPPLWRIVRSIVDGSINCHVDMKVLVEGTDKSRRNGILGCRLGISITPWNVSREEPNEA